jgi:multidrug resistance efflux pump
MNASALARPLVQTWPDYVAALDAWTDGQVVDVEAPPRGIVERVLATKNQLVEKGDPLVQLDRRIEVVAPVSGRLVGLDVHPGDVVDRSRPLASILYSNDLWVLAHFDPDEFARLQFGQHARVQIGMLVIAGRVSGLIGAGDPVLIDLVGRNRTALRPGMDAVVSVEVD